MGGSSVYQHMLTCLYQGRYNVHHNRFKAAFCDSTNIKGYRSSVKQEANGKDSAEPAIYPNHAG